MHYQDVASYVVATDRQRDLLASQQKHFNHAKPQIKTIPVGSLEHLVKPKEARKKHSLITASRLANEKHIDWVIAATVAAHKIVPDLTLDIYGEVVNGRSRLQDLITKKIMPDSYIKLMGQHDLKMFTKSMKHILQVPTSEGFGLSFNAEAVGSRLIDDWVWCSYGNQTFIADQQNGYLRHILKIGINSRKEQLLAEANC